MKKLLISVLILITVLAIGCSSSPASTPAVEPTPAPAVEPTPTPAWEPTPDPELDRFKQTVYTLRTSIDPRSAGYIVRTSDPGSGIGGSFRAIAGLQIDLTAIPFPAYTFDHWSGDATGTASTTTITMDSHKKVIAHFKPIEGTRPADRDDI